MGQALFVENNNKRSEVKQCIAKNKVYRNNIMLIRSWVSSGDKFKSTLK